MGYDYKNRFQRLKTIRTNDFQQFFGTTEWNGNIIPFLDSLIQSTIFNNPVRQLMVPVMIRSIKIDPKVLSNAIRNNKLNEETTENIKVENDIEGFKSDEQKLNELQETFKIQQFCPFDSILPFYYNYNTKRVITHGLEIENIIGLPIERKTDSTNLILDSYEFIPNDDMKSIEEYDYNYINNYLEVRIFYIY